MSIYVPPDVDAMATPSSVMEPPRLVLLCSVSVVTVSLVAFVEAPPCEKVTFGPVAQLSSFIVSFSVKTTFASVPAAKMAVALAEHG